MKRPIAILAATALLSLAVACGGSTDKPSDTAGQPPAASTSQDKAPAVKGSAADSCKLVSAARVGEIMGEPMADGVGDAPKTQGNVTISQCTWLAATPKSDSIASVFIRKSSAKDSASVFESTRKTFADAVEVAGLDTKAYYIPSSGQLNLLAGDAWIIVTASTEGLTNPREVTDAQRALASTAVAAYRG